MIQSMPLKPIKGSKCQNCHHAQKDPDRFLVGNINTSQHLKDRNNTEEISSMLTWIWYTNKTKRNCRIDCDIVTLKKKSYNVLRSAPLTIFVCAKLLQPCPTLCKPMDCMQPARLSVHGILQARTVRWVAMPFSRGSSQFRDQTCVSYVSYIGKWVLFHQRHLGSTPS